MQIVSAGVPFCCSVAFQLSFLDCCFFFFPHSVIFWNLVTRAVVFPMPAMKGNFLKQTSYIKKKQKGCDHICLEDEQQMCLLLMWSLRGDVQEAEGGPERY